jgi:hypothetical protein
MVRSNLVATSKARQCVYEVKMSLTVAGLRIDLTSTAAYCCTTANSPLSTRRTNPA